MLEQNYIVFPIGVGNVVELIFSKRPTSQDMETILRVLEILRPNVTMPDPILLSTE